MSSSATTGGEPASLMEAPPPWSHVSFSPAPAWVEVPSFDRTLAARKDDHLTYLAWERQVNLTLETSFHTTAIRLETAVAVQHQSQWRLNLDPRFQQLKLHWLRVVRGTESSDRLRRDRMRLIQREAQLDHLVIDGQWTLLVVLDDVRVGDVIEAAYSFEGKNPIRAGGCEVFFTVPSMVVVGSYRLRLEFDGARSDLTCMASPDAPARKEEQLADGGVRWTWQGQQLVPREFEPNQPSTFLDYVWIQVSDLADWTPLAGRLAEVWARENDSGELSRWPEFARPEVVDERAVHGLVRVLQDDFRYLSVDLESGGWIPTRPGVVAQRRYGDCKDLAWLATSVLRNWGVAARPILVGTGLRERVQAMRPMALLFNHAVLEVELAGQVRWFDLTLRYQGGDFRSQPVPWYGYGLPVEPHATLRAQPGPRSSGLYALRETIRLSARRGETSLVELKVWAEGWNGDHLRRARSTQGADDFAKERLEHIRRRYGKAERLGGLQWRDDRARNVCEIAEAFEIPDACYLDESGQRALFDVPANLLIQTFVVPEEKKRRGAWDLPHRMEVRHQICLRGGSYTAGPSQRRSWVCPEFAATLEEPREDGTWSKIMRFQLKTDEVAVDRIADYRRILERFLLATTWRIYLPREEKRVSGGDAVGALPSPAEGINAYVAPANLADFTDVTTAAPEASAPTVTRGGNAIRRWVSSNGAWRFAIPVGILVALTLARSVSMLSEGTLRTTDAFRPVSRSTPPLVGRESVEESLPPEPPIHGIVYEHANELDRPAEALSQARPKYPSDLRILGIGGRATIEFVVTADGLPARIRVVNQTHASFGKAACLAVSKWRFRPAMKAGQPVNSTVRVPIVFQLDGEGPQKTIFDSGARPLLEGSPSLLPNNRR